MRLRQDTLDEAPSASHIGGAWPVPSPQRGAPLIVERTMTRRDGDDRRSSPERREDARRQMQRRGDDGNGIGENRRGADRRGENDQRGGSDRRVGDRRATPDRRMMMAFAF